MVHMMKNNYGRTDGACSICLVRKADSDLRRQRRVWLISIGRRFCSGCIEDVLQLRLEAEEDAKAEKAT